LVFCSTGYNTGSALLKLSPTGDGGVKAEEVYFLPATEFQNHHGGMVLLNGYVYGGHGHNQGAPTCIELATGRVMWKGDQLGTGSAAVCAADGLLIFRYQADQVFLLEATPAACRVKGMFRQQRFPGARGMAWAHPVVVGGKLYLRHADVLLCYDLKNP
jgi:outer membrane protein assembly factor BamB